MDGSHRSYFFYNLNICDQYLPCVAYLNWLLSIMVQFLPAPNLKSLLNAMEFKTWHQPHIISPSIKWTSWKSSSNFQGNLCQTTEGSLEIWLSHFLFTYRNIPHTTTNFTSRVTTMMSSSCPSRFGVTQCFRLRYTKTTESKVDPR